MTTSRKLFLYTITAGLEEGSVNYQRLFEKVAALSVDARYLTRQDRLIAIPKLFFARGKVFCASYEGTRGLNPLFFNPRDASERIQDLTSGEILATKTHAVFDPSRRLAVIEYNHRGAKANDIAKILENAARTIDGWEAITLEFVPITVMEFLDAIEQFERISSASIRVVRPNPGWTDQFDHLNSLGGESNAQTVEIGASARRGGSLAANNGIVKLIKNLVRQVRSSVKNAHICGNRIETLGLSTVSLSRFQEHKKATVQTDENGHVKTADIQEQMTEYLDSHA